MEEVLHDELALVEVLCLLLRLVRRIKLLFTESHPVEILEPAVTFHFVWAVETQPPLRLPQQAAIDKVSSLQRPALRHILPSNLNLLGRDLCADFLAGWSFIGATAQHQLVGDNAHGEVVDSNAVVLSS